MKKFVAFVACLLVSFVSSASYGQVFFANTRTTTVSHYHSTVGTATAIAIPSASVGGNLMSWKICNDAIQSGGSTFMSVGQAADVSTDGVVIAPGACFECGNCTPATLKAMKVEGQAAGNGYSVIMFKH
jgi:hypothetical protein